MQNRYKLDTIEAGLAFLQDMVKAVSDQQLMEICDDLTPDESAAHKQELTDRVIIPLGQILHDFETASKAAKKLLPPDQQKAYERNLAVENSPFFGALEGIGDSRLPPIIRALYDIEHRLDGQLKTANPWLYEDDTIPQPSMVAERLQTYLPDLESLACFDLVLQLLRLQNAVNEQDKRAR